MKGSPGCPISGPLSPVHHNHKQPKTRPGCLKPRFGVRPAGRLGENNNMTGTHTILHQKTVMTNGVQVQYSHCCSHGDIYIWCKVWSIITEDH